VAPYENTNLTSINVSSRTATFSATDASTTVNDTATINVSAFPTTINLAATLNYAQGTSATAIDSNLILSGQIFSSASVTLTNGSASEDVLTATPTGSINVSFDAGTSVLSLSGSGTAAEYQQVLRSVSYANSNLTTIDISRRTITFSATDSLSATVTDTATINITAFPTAITSGAILNYAQGAAASVIDASLTLSGQIFNSATVTLTDGTPGEDVLTATAAGPILVSFNAVSSVLTLSGSGTAAEYQTVFRSVTYENTNLTSINVSSRTALTIPLL